MPTTHSMIRRVAIVMSLAAIATAAGVTVRINTLNAAPSASSATVEPSNDWLTGLKGTHRQFFDNPSVNGGIALVHVMNYYDTYNKAFGVKDADISAVLTFYGATTFYALNDAVWAKYKLGEFVDATDPVTGKPATTNPWR